MATMQSLYPVSNDADELIAKPYGVLVEIIGVSPFLFHRWSVEAVAEKAAAKKGSKAKKEDNIESYVYRTNDGELYIPSEYFRMSAVNAAKYHQDPRSPRKSAMDLMKAGLISLEEVCGTGQRQWDFIDQRRVQIQRNGVTRSRPALAAGWKVTSQFQILLPEYITPTFLQSILIDAGRLVGVGDFRPTYGRFHVTSFSVV
jgi:hypothetical protein